jgi:hypothetical protein
MIIEGIAWHRHDPMLFSDPGSALITLDREMEVKAMSAPAVSFNPRRAG